MEVIQDLNPTSESKWITLHELYLPVASATVQMRLPRISIVCCVMAADVAISRVNVIAKASLNVEVTPSKAIKFYVYLAYSWYSTPDALIRDK